MAPPMPCALQNEPQIAFYRADAVRIAQGAARLLASRDENGSLTHGIAADIGGRD